MKMAFCFPGFCFVLFMFLLLVFMRQGRGLPFYISYSCFRHKRCSHSKWCVTMLVLRTPYTLTHTHLPFRYLYLLLLTIVISVLFYPPLSKTLKEQPPPPSVLPEGHCNAAIFLNYPEWKARFHY